jgi:hypothetical protein
MSSTYATMGMLCFAQTAATLFEKMSSDHNDCPANQHYNVVIILKELGARELDQEQSRISFS